MIHWDTLAPKLLVSGLPVALILTGIGGLAFLPSILLALTLALASYFVGDQMILPIAGNFIATAGDAGFAFLVLWAAHVVGIPFRYGAIWVAVLVLVIVEGAFYHSLFERVAVTSNRDPRMDNGEW